MRTNARSAGLRMAPLTLVVAAALLVAAPVGAAEDEPSPLDGMGAVRRAILAWDTAAAEAALTPLLARLPDHDELRVLEAHVRHMQHDYAGAVEALGDLCDDDRPGDSELAQLCHVVKGSEEATRNFRAVTTPGGHFVIHYKEGPDEILLPYAFTTLDSAWRELGALFGYYPERPVHIDILPQVEALARMTPLTRDEIETSGTIALCKYDRMMVVSPRDLVYGYEWLDTLAHEYIHYLLTRMSGNRVPLWLHEGLAKYFEGLWKPGTRPRLSPVAEHLLAEGVREKRLIPLEKLHPSIAKLPSQDDAALAFAQVFTLVDWLHRKHGAEGLRTLLVRLTGGEELDVALRAVYGASFEGLERAWRDWVERHGWRRIPHAYRPRRLFRGSDRSEDELQTIEEERSRDLTYLGDLLRARGRDEAALKEYRKAVAVEGTSSPVLQAKMAAALLTLRRPDEVLEAVTTVLDAYPEYVLLHLYRGEALLRLGQPADALSSLVAANALNPFDPRLHALLAEAYEAVGDSAAAELERRQQGLLGDEP